eukprot:6190707-Pleurochrysis_carterae.AAC.2
MVVRNEGVTLGQMVGARRLYNAIAACQARSAQVRLVEAAVRLTVGCVARRQRGRRVRILAMSLYQDV